MRPALYAMLTLGLSMALLGSPAPRALAGDEAPSRRGVADIVNDLKSKDDAVRLAAAEESARHGDDELTSPLVRLLTDDRFDIRKAAVEGLLARGGDKARKTAAAALAARLPKLVKAPESQGELILVINALHDFAEPSTMKALLGDIDQDTPEEVIRARVMAVGNIPSKDAIDELILFLSRQGRGRWQGAKRHVVDALGYATGEKLGADPDKWRAWWHDAEKTFDLRAAAERRTGEREKRDDREERRKERERRREGAGEDDGEGAGKGKGAGAGKDDGD